MVETWKDWIKEKRVKDLKEADKWLSQKPKTYRILYEFKIIPVDVHGKKVDLSNKQIYRPYAFDIYSKPKENAWARR